MTNRRYAVDVDVTLRSQVTILVDASSPEQAFDTAHDTFDVTEISTYDLMDDATVTIDVDSIEDVTI